jgi:hypothetical protein
MPRKKKPGRFKKKLGAAKEKISRMKEKRLILLPNFKEKKVVALKVPIKTVHRLKRAELELAFQKPGTPEFKQKLEKFKKVTKSIRRRQKTKRALMLLLPDEATRSAIVRFFKAGPQEFKRQKANRELRRLVQKGKLSKKEYESIIKQQRIGAPGLKEAFQGYLEDLNHRERMKVATVTTRLIHEKPGLRHLKDHPRIMEFIEQEGKKRTKQRIHKEYWKDGIYFGMFAVPELIPELEPIEWAVRYRLLNPEDEVAYNLLRATSKAHEKVQVGHEEQRLERRSEEKDKAKILKSLLEWKKKNKI